MDQSLSINLYLASTRIVSGVFVAAATEAIKGALNRRVASRGDAGSTIILRIHERRDSTERGAREPLQRTAYHSERK